MINALIAFDRIILLCFFHILQKGQIYCRAMPQMALTMVDKWKIDTTFMDGKTPAQGYAVGLERR